jgi:cytochrome P450
MGVARDDHRFGAKVTGLGAVNLLPELDDVTAVLFEQDPPEHTIWRTAMQPFFTPAAVGRLEPYIRATARRLLDELKPRGAADLVSDLAVRVPPLVLAVFLGVPESQREEMSALTRAYFAGDTTVSEAFAAFLYGQVRDRRGRPGADVLSWVVNAMPGGHRLTEREALKHLMVMVAAGYLTTGDALGNLLLLLAEDHGLRQRVREDSALVPALIEESLRHESAVASTGRTVLVETELGGVPLSPGDRLLLAWGSGNRDEAQFHEPEQVRLDRPRGRRHLAWGAGVHRCIGMQLARLELRIVLEEVLRAIPDYRLALGATPQRTFGVTRGVRSLQVTWVA